MRFSQSLGGLVAIASLSHAFPAGIVERVASDPVLKARADAILQARGNENGDAPALPETFNEDQLIDVTGANAWVAPGPDDNRGPCPGLNAFANHGFLPHDGYATITQFVDATTKVVGMGPILAGFLAVLGATLDGSGTAWSIGGTPKSVPIGLTNLVGTGNGISGSHNKYESDVSPTRPDLYEFGDNYKVRIAQFQEMVDAASAAGTDNFNIPFLTDFRSQRFDDSVQNNPYFFNGPFTGVLVQPAAYTFIYRFMANHTAEAPYGVLDLDLLKSWFSISGDSGSFTWTEGYERIPENWYRRDLQQPYENTYFLLDVAYAAAKYPKFLDVGGNTGTTNSFTGVDVSDLTGGVMNSESLAQGDNFACLAYQAAAQASPDVLQLGTTNLISAITGLTGALSCPQLETLDEGLFAQFPGWNKTS